MRATLDIEGLEQDLEQLFNLVKERIQAADGSTDPQDLAGVLAASMMMEGMGEVLKVVGRHIEEAEARERFLRLQRRFAGYKGAARGATNTITRRIERARQME